MKNFKLTKDEVSEFEGLYQKVDDAGAALFTAADKFNEALIALRDEFAPAIERYNDAVNELREFAGNIAGEADGLIADKSENWQDSERGRLAGEFRDKWQEIEGLLDYDAELPNDLDIEDPRSDLPEQDSVPLDAFES